MKRTFTLIVVLAAFFSAHPFAQQQTALPTIDQVLDKYIEALGGRAAIEKLTSRVTRGSMETPDGQQVGTITISEKAPNKSLAVVDVAGMGMIRQGTDGTVAWEDQPGAGVSEKTGPELADALRDGTFSSELKMKSTYKTLVVTKREKVGTKDAYAVLATPAAGTPITLYFDVESGLMVRQASSRDTAQGRVDVDVFLEDYRVVDGVKQPFIVRQMAASFSFIIRISEIKHNVALDDAMFKRPGYVVGGL